MDGINKDLVKKAKRRIKRAILTRESVARVRNLGDNLYEYVYKHKSGFIRFRADKLGRLRLL